MDTIMRSYVVYSTFAGPKRILAPDDGAAIKHYVRAHLLNGGGPVVSPRFRVYDGEPLGPASTLH